MNKGNEKENNQQQQTGQGQNETLKDPGARVADYGRAGQGLMNEGGVENQNSGRQGNSSIPLDEEDTIGNP